MDVFSFTAMLWMMRNTGRTGGIRQAITIAVAIVGWLTGWQCAEAQSITVSTATAFRNALKKLHPGDEIRLLPGVYDGEFAAANLHGTAEAPIRIRGILQEDPPVIRGGSNGFYFCGASHLVLEDLVIEKAASNGINIDDAGDHARPSHHVTLKNILVREIGAQGNQDGIKLSGVDDFQIISCKVEGWGKGGQGMDLVGCHRGRIEKCRFDGRDVGPIGFQSKGGSSEILVEECDFLRISERCAQIGGSTGLQFFRPKPEGFEARQVTIRECRFNRGAAAVSFVNVDGAVVERNVIYRPQRYVVRILQEQTATGFTPSRNGRFTENVVVWRNDELKGGVAGAGPGTAPETFEFADNFWYREDFPQLSLPKGFPTSERGSVLGQDPKLIDPDQGDLRPLRSRESMRKATEMQPSWWPWLPLAGRTAGYCAAAVIVCVGLFNAVRSVRRTWPRQQRDGSQVSSRPSIQSAFAALAIVTSVLAVYGSLVPLNYQPKDFNATWLQFLKTPYLQLDIYRLADWIANILLFIPMSYCAWAALAMNSRSVGFKSGVGLLVWVACAGLAVAVEFLQLWFPPRTVSQNDILAEWIGSGVGCVAAALTAARVGCWLSKTLESVRPLQMADAALQCYVLCFVIYAVMPLDFAVTKDALALKWKLGRISWSWGGTSSLTPLELMRGLLDVIPAIPMGIWIGRRFDPYGINPKWFKSLLASLAAAFLIEGTQVFVFSRYASLAAAVLAFVGILIGTQLAPLFSRQFDGWWTNDETHSRRRLVCLFVGFYTAGLVFLLAQPQHWHSMPLAASRLQDFWTPPFSALYWGSEFDALTRVTQSVLLFVPLGFGLADLCYSTTDSTRSWRWTLATLFGLASFATVIELSQVWVPGTTVDNTSTIAFLAGGLTGYFVREILQHLAATNPSSPATSFRFANLASLLGLATTACSAVLITFFTVREVVAWNGSRGLPRAMAHGDPSESRHESTANRSTTGRFAKVDPAHAKLRVTRIVLPNFEGASAIWGSSGRDDRGGIWFGVSAAQGPGASARLMRFEPDSKRVREMGTVVTELRRLNLQCPGESQAKIHSRIVQGSDGCLYFTSMDEQGEADDGSRLPTYGSHLWRVRPDRPQFEHLAGVPEGLIAVAASGRYIYALGLFDHVVYQFDTFTSALKSVHVGSVGGHISRNLLADGRGHAYVPRLRFVGKPGERPPGVPLTQSASVHVSLVELDEELQQRAEWPIDHYLTNDRWTSHGITAQCQLRSGALLFVTSAGYLYRIDLGIGTESGQLTPVGWVHPHGPSYVASMFCTDERSQLLCLSRSSQNSCDAVLYDLEAKRSTAIPLELPPDVDAASALLYGCTTRDDSGMFYIVGTENDHPLLLRGELVSRL